MITDTHDKHTHHPILSVRILKCDGGAKLQILILKCHKVVS